MRRGEASAFDAVFAAYRRRLYSYLGNGDDGAMKVADLARGLPPIDVEPSNVARIVAFARRDVGHGPPKRRWIEAILVGAIKPALYLSHPDWY